MTRNAKGEAGFSLLETLLGLTLTAMIGVLMMGSLQIGTRVWERQDKAILPGEEQLLLGQSGEWLAQAMPAKLRSVDDPPYTPFAGEASRASFLYSAPGMGASPGVYAIDLELIEAQACEGGRRLMMRIARILPFEADEAPKPMPTEQRELVACIASPSFAFWGARQGETEAAWHTDWTLQFTLPSVVRLRSMSPAGVERVVLTQRLLNAQIAS
jgi:hypothetical protein